MFLSRLSTACRNLVPWAWRPASMPCSTHIARSSTPWRYRGAGPLRWCLSLQTARVGEFRSVEQLQETLLLGFRAWSLKNRPLETPLSPSCCSSSMDLRTLNNTYFREAAVLSGGRPVSPGRPLPLPLVQNRLCTLPHEMKRKSNQNLFINKNIPR